MPHIIETTAYKFEELTEAAQQQAIDNNRDFNVDYDWWDMTYDDAANVGIKITGFDLGRGRSIDGELLWSAEEVAKTVLENHGEQCDTYKLSEAFIKQLTVLQVTEKLAGDEDGEIEAQIEDISEEFRKDIVNAYWKILDNEYDYLTSDEAIKECLISNNYDFEEDGTRI